MKKFLSLCYFVIGFSSTLWAQEKVTLSGYIRDVSSGEDLIGATVYIKELQTGGAANVYGFFSVTVPKGDYTLQVSYIGYQPFEKQVSLNSNTSLNFELQLNAEELEEVVVTAEETNSNVVNNEMSTLKIAAKTIKSIPAVLGEPDVIKSIQLLPGITSVADGASGFNVRGGSADQNLILLDEGIIYNSAHLLGFYSVVNPDAVKDIKIYKGGIPARYGGRLSSVLDVRQREGNMKEFNGEAGIGLISGRLLLEGPIVKDKGSFMLAARRSYGDAFLALLGNNNTAYFYDINLKTNYIINEKNRVYLSGYFGRDKFDLGSIFNNEWGNATGTLRWNSVLSSKLFANISVNYSNYDYFLDNLPKGAEYRWKSNIITYNTKADFNYYVNDKNQFEFGVDQKWYTFKPGTITPIRGSNISTIRLDEKYADEAGLYASYQLNLGKFSLDAGLRYSRFVRRGNQEIPNYENGEPVVFNQGLNRYEAGEQLGMTSFGSGNAIATFDGWEPRISATYVINPQNSIKASYHRIYQYIHLISNSTAPTPLDVWTPSGPFIEPQSTDQYAIGYFKNFKEDKYEASIEAYYKDLYNMVDYIDGADLLTNNNIETELLSGIGRSYGLELYIKKNTGKLTGWLSYTLAKSERKVEGLGQNDTGINNGEFYPTNFDKRHDLSLTAIYELSDRWSISGNFVYASGIPGTFPEGRYEYAGIIIPQYSERNQNRLPDYHRLDISATLKAKLKNGVRKNNEWVFGFYNLYNRANASSIYFIENEDVRGETKAFKSYLFGITPSITYNFKF